MILSPFIKVCLTTGTRTVNSRILSLYEPLVFACIAGFAAYDLKKKRVSDRALFFFCPLAFLAPFVHIGFFWNQPLLLISLFCSLGGAAAGFLILLAAAMLSLDGAGIGGGDIKLAAVMGFIYGPSRMLAVLLIASGLATGLSLAVGRKHQEEKLSLPFVPFLMAGSLTVTLAAIL
ncbi:prepilin peptidase [Enterocloster clostridioformis]|uniref:Flp pilus assembly protein, protease CpaA n=1 Tax=Enterocloster clostridioformis TaxID=1531 RepID=A0A2X2U1F6_9FIRM|nr:prepilin peptidase [Enterocloster clostridioformis]MCA5577254.1 prepilin peptidase [Enterocloster clostridioformis]SQB10174.1 Flp pilus assembly protein, protease CpaA [Enterocloster clostridioformis]